MRDIVNGNDGLNIMMNEIVNHEMNKTLDEMISVVEEWKKSSYVVSCDAVLNLLKSNKTEPRTICIKGDKMGEYGQEIPQEENDKRLFLIELRNGVCPICEVNIVERIENIIGVDLDNTGSYIYHCRRCGIVARKRVSFTPDPFRPGVYHYF